MSKPARKKPAPRKRAKRNHLSREMILTETLVMLEAEPCESLSMAKIAQALGVVPMALYRHIENRDDLMDGVLGLVLGKLEFDIADHETWQSRVSVWMRTVFSHLNRHPNAVKLLGRSGRTSPAWFESVGVLIAVLLDAGFKGKKLAYAEQWVTHVTMGIVMQERDMPFELEIESAEFSLDSVSDGTKKTMVPMIKHMKVLNTQKMFDVYVEFTVNSLEVALDGKR